MTKLKTKGEIRNQNIKKEKKIGDEEYIEVPLENETYILFLLANQGRTIGDSRVSQIRSSYKELCKKIGVRNRVAAILDVYEKGVNAKKIAEEIGIRKEFVELLLQCIEDIVKENKNWKKIEIKSESEKQKLIEKITKQALHKKTERMIQQCEKIKESYQQIKEERAEEKIRENIKNNLQEQFIQDFFDDWKQNFAEKYAYITGKKQKIEEELPEFLKQNVLKRFQEYLEEEPDMEPVLLKSLKQDFFKRKGNDGYSICQSTQMRAEKMAQAIISNKIALEHHIDIDFIMDVLEYLQKKENNRNKTETLVLKIQEKHLYQYFWA